MKKLNILVPVVIVFLITGCKKDSYLESKAVSKADICSTDTDCGVDSPVSGGYVQISGAVNSPGVYEIQGETRLFQVIEMAGGFSEDAALDDINQVEIVSDGQFIRIPTVGEIEAQRQENKEACDGRININTAGKEILMTLPGIGERKACMIIDYRESHGGFNSAEDIMNIQGIKEGVFNKIKDKITVG